MTYQEPHRAPADIVNGALTMLVCALLTLRPEHRAKLIARGLSDDEIRRLRYVSAPATREERRRVADALAPYLDVFGGGIPGFYFADGRWELVYCAPGFLIPARNEWGQIQALALRADELHGGAKYVWLSSNPEAEDDRGGQKYPSGASSGAPIHFSNRPALWTADEVVVTEGTLKADCIAALSGLPVVGVAGVNNTRGLAERLRRNFQQLRRVNVAFDKDVLTKPHVAEALERLITQLEGERFTVRVRTWVGDAKGFDDYLLSQMRAGEVAAR
jgi:DNA primase